MRIHLLIIALLCLGIAQAQSPTDSTTSRGVGLPKKDKMPSPGRTFAVIVGVSTYKKIKPLDFADKDALLFKEFLQSKAGGSLKDSNILILLNEEVKPDIFPQIVKWINKAAPTEGDRFYFYFAGHGDAVNSKNVFFLLPDCDPHGNVNNYFIGNVVRLQDLKTTIFEEMLLNKHAQVILVWALAFAKSPQVIIPLLAPAIAFAAP